MKIKQLNIILGILVMLTVSVFVYFYTENRSLYAQMPVFASDREISSLELLYTFGNGDSKEQNLKQPMDIAVDEMGKAYVLDHADRQVKVYDPNGKFVLSFGKGGEGSGALSAPASLAVQDEMILVAEPSIGKIQAFSKSGEFIRTFFTTPKDERYSPVGMIGVEDGHILFTDVAGHRIVEIDSEGKVISAFGKPGGGDGQFAYPHDIVMDSSQRLYVSDSNNGRIQIFDRKGQYLGKIDGTKGEKGKMSLPRGVTIDPYQRLLVIDALSHQIRFFEGTGESLFDYGELGVEDGQLNFPNGIAVDGKKIFIADRENHRVQVFAANSE